MKSRPLPGLTSASLLEDLGAPAPSRFVPLGSIDVIPGFNPRSIVSGSDPFTAERLEDLVASIRDHGVLQPILVRPSGSRFELILGERRYHAARLAGLDRIPASVQKLSDQAALEAAITENSQRRDLDLVSDTLAGFRYLASLTGRPESELPAYLLQLRNGTAADEHDVRGRLRSLYGTSLDTWALQRSKVLKMNEAERLAIRDGRLDAKAAYELVALPPGSSERAALLDDAIRNSLSAAQVRERVRNHKRAPAAGESWPERVKRSRDSLARLARLDNEADMRRARELLDELDRLIQRAGPQRRR